MVSRTQQSPGLPHSRPLGTAFRCWDAGQVPPCPQGGPPSQPPVPAHSAVAPPCPGNGAAPLGQGWPGAASAPIPAGCSSFRPLWIPSGTNGAAAAASAAQPPPALPEQPELRRSGTAPRRSHRSPVRVASHTCTLYTPLAAPSRPLISALE